jgi:hypothetical protein
MRTFAQVNYPLSEDPSKLLALSEQAGSSDTEELSLLVGLAELNQSLFLRPTCSPTAAHFLKRQGGNGLTA